MNLGISYNINLGLSDNVNFDNQLQNSTSTSIFQTKEVEITDAFIEMRRTIPQH